MTSGWTLFIIIVTALNIVGAVWLLYATSRSSPDEGKAGTDTGHTWDGDLREYNNPLPRWWLWLFYGTVVYAIGYLIVYPGLGSFAGTKGWTQESQWQEEVDAANAASAPVYARFAAMDLPALAADPDAMRVGRNLYSNHCAMCHGADAGGSPGFPNLTDGDWLWGGDAESIHTTLKYGRMSAMPAWEAQLGAAGIEETVAYVLTLSGQQPASEQSNAGKARFDLFCVACHGPEGKGNPLLGAPNLTDSIWLYGGTPEVIRTTLVKGRLQNQMPAQLPLLGEDKTRLMAAYVMSISPRPAEPVAPVEPVAPAAEDATAN
ncbi:MAG: cytochrome-c oxidase, cbb3-type subunit III [Steroidobacteraceae bacterium]|nr:cytochrome-c oxidase, cbb3-type subunit III [Steroidobacteraceae bacterium]